MDTQGHGPAHDSPHCAEHSEDERREEDDPDRQGEEDDIAVRVIPVRQPHVAPDVEEIHADGEDDPRRVEQIEPEMTSPVAGKSSGPL